MDEPAGNADEVRKPIHRPTRTVGFDGPTAADVFGQVARYCAEMRPGFRIYGVNIDYDIRLGDPDEHESVVVSITYDDLHPRRRQEETR